MRERMKGVISGFMIISVSQLTISLFLLIHKNSMIDAVESGIVKLMIEESGLTKMIRDSFHLSHDFSHQTCHLSISSTRSFLSLTFIATKKQARVDVGEDIVIGVNKYQKNQSSSSSENQNENETVQVLSIDNTKVRTSQISYLQSVKSSRDEQKVQNVLQKLKQSAFLTSSSSSSTENEISTSEGGNENNLLKLAIDCARERCTLGFEILYEIER